MNWDFITENIKQVASIGMMFVGLVILAMSKKARWGQALSTGGIALIGAAFIAVPALFLAAGDTIGTGLLK